MKFNPIFLPLNKKETLSSLILLPVYLVGSLLLFPLESQGIFLPYFLFMLACFLAAALYAKRFWKETFTNLSIIGKPLIWKVPLAALLNKVLCVFLNDILLLFDFPYFTGSEWGPMLYDPRLRLLEQWGTNSFVIALVCMVVFVPVVEELLFRGLILGRIYEKSTLLGVVLSTALFAVFRTLPYLSMAASGHEWYLLVYFLQHIPYCLFLSWLYISTDSIAAPILMQMIYNYFDVLPG